MRFIERRGSRSNWYSSKLNRCGLRHSISNPPNNVVSVLAAAGCSPQLAAGALDAARRSRRHHCLDSPAVVWRAGTPFTHTAASLSAVTRGSCPDRPGHRRGPPSLSRPPLGRPAAAHEPPRQNTAVSCTELCPRAYLPPPLVPPGPSAEIGASKAVITAPVAGRRVMEEQARSTSHAAAADGRFTALQQLGGSTRAAMTGTCRPRPGLGKKATRAWLNRWSLP